MSSNTMATIRRLLIEQGIMNVLVVDNEQSVNVGTQGYKADLVIFDDLLCKPEQPIVPTKPYYTQLMGRWAQ